MTWNNFGLEKTNRDLRTYELSSEIMSWLGFETGNINKLHQYVKNNPSLVSEQEYQDMICWLAYDMLYGGNYQFSGKNPYEKTNMRMGTLPITADNIKVMGDTLYVQGSGFTQKSKIFVNGEKVSTIMLSRYSLMASGVTLNDGDLITVGQSSSKREVLSYSDSITYNQKTHFIADEDLDISS